MHPGLLNLFGFCLAIGILMIDPDNSWIDLLKVVAFFYVVGFFCS